MWEDPEVTGRPDFYYIIEYSDPDDASIYHRHNKDGVKGNSYTLDNLRPDTIYIIRVSVHNGVSDQDSENTDDRMVDIKAHTTEGCKYTVYIICIVFSPSESLMYMYRTLKAHTSDLSTLISCFFYSNS